MTGKPRRKVRGKLFFAGKDLQESPHGTRPNKITGQHKSVLVFVTILWRGPRGNDLETSPHKNLHNAERAGGKKTEKLIPSGRRLQAQSGDKDARTKASRPKASQGTQACRQKRRPQGRASREGNFVSFTRGENPCSYYVFS